MSATFIYRMIVCGMGVVVHARVEERKRLMRLMTLADSVQVLRK